MNSSDLRFYFRTFLRRLPIVLVVWMLVTAAAVSVAYLLPPVYRAAAKILVQSQQIPGNLAQSTVPIGAVEQIQILQQRLMTRENMLEIADKYEIFRDRPSLSRSDIVDEMRNSTGFLNLQLLKFGSDRRTQGATAFEVSFGARTARMSAQVANEFVTRILDRNVKLRTNRATETLEFFQQESERLSGELTVLEAKMLDFKNMHSDALPDSLAFRRNQVVLLQDRLLRLESSDASVRQTIYLAEQALKNPLQAAAGQPMTRNQRDLENLEAQLVQQSAVFSAKHPTIIALDKRVKALKEVVKQEILDAGDNPQGSLLPGNKPLNDLKAQLQLILNQKESVLAEIEQLQKSIEGTPKNEIALNVFNRDYANLKTQYDTIRASLAQAATGERIELRQKGERFEVIEQATPPEEPESPNRIAIAVGGSFAGLTLGLGLLLFLEFLNGSVRRPIELINKLNIQPLATIPYIVTYRERSRKRLGFLSVLLLLGVSVPSILYAIHYYYLPIDLILQNVIDKFGLNEFVARMSG